MEKTRATSIEIISRVHLEDDGTAKKIALIGGYGDGPVSAIDAPRVDDIFVHAHQIATDLMYDNTHGGLYLKYFLNCEYDRVSDSELEKLQAKEEVLSMPCWPKEGSVMILGDTAIVKLSEP